MGMDANPELRAIRELRMPTQECKLANLNVSLSMIEPMSL